MRLGKMLAKSILADKIGKSWSATEGRELYAASIIPLKESRMAQISDRIRLAGRSVTVRRFNTIVVGTGAAGLNAADYLHGHGQKDLAVVTEGLRMGTSLNTGSDKQTYYKLTLAGGAADSVRQTAQTLFSGGAMDGDIALAEAAGSARSFFRLVDKGVPFPQNAFGEFIGYKTDHDPVMRGTSCGPLTSKFMTEKLLAAVRDRGIPIFDRHQAIEILAAPDSAGGRKTLGVLALDLEALDDPDYRYVLFAATNVVFATGGEAGMYETSVYPPSQTGSTGLAFRAGVRGKNLTESQYGLASVKFRWNLSGTYQQVIPRYVSTDAAGGDAREFLDPFFPDPGKMLLAIFLKGYQWPFDPRKVADHGSSLIDILVYHETMVLNRRVFLDYRRNPSRAGENGGFDPAGLPAEARAYLANSGAFQATPIARLAHMNPGAIELYQTHGIDLESELLEIAVSAQHNNGGLEGDAWWQSRLRGFFPIGEVNGTHGVYRPGGSALNSGQVGGMRAAEYIIARRQGEAPTGEQVAEWCGGQLRAAVMYGENALACQGEALDLPAERRQLSRRMSRHGAHIRSAAGVAEALAEAEGQLRRLSGEVTITAPGQLRFLHQLRDLAVCQYVYLFAIHDYITRGGRSRGSYLVHSPEGELPAPGLPERFRFSLADGAMRDLVQEVGYGEGGCEVEWRPVRPIPELDEWFENVWKEYLSGGIYG